MGRRSLREQRRDSIFAAAADCIRKHGLERTTLDGIARRAGVQRTIIRHYVGNRDAVLTGLAEHLTQKYRRDFLDRIARFPQRRRLAALLEFLFAGEFLTRPADDAVIDALWATAAKDRRARACLRRIYGIFEDACFDELRTEFPRMASRRLRAIAYSVMCLAEENCVLLGLGFPQDRSRAAQRAAELLIESLRSAAGPKPRQQENQR